MQWLHDEFLPHVRNTDWPTAQRRCLDRAAAHASKATTRPLDSVLSSPLTSLTDVVHAAQLQHALSRDVGGAVEAEGTRACANGSEARPGVTGASKAPAQHCAGVGARTLVPVESDHALSARNDSSAGGRRGSPLEALLWTAATVTVRQVACSLIAPEARGNSFYGLIEPGYGRRLLTGGGITLRFELESSKAHNCKLGHSRIGESHRYKLQCRCPSCYSNLS